MNRTPVKSSNIASIGFDAKNEILEIEFLNGSVYQYYDLSEQEHEALMKADSHGQYLARNIKGNYRYSKV